MKEEARLKHLTELAKMNHGEALRDWLNIEIKRLENISLVPEENFEVEARGRRAAAKTLRGLFKFLVNMKQEKSEREKNPYT